jgi:hypothetical protein
MIEFLIDNGAKDINSYVATVIYFTSSNLNDLDYWKKQLEFLTDDITYHIAVVESTTADLPLMSAFFDTDFADNFNEDVERIRNKRNK